MDARKTGLFIAQKRKAINMSQRELADHLHITDKAVSKWERGLSSPDISILIPLAEILNVSLYDLLTGGYYMWIKDFVRRHPDVIARGSIPYSEIIEKLKQEYEAVEISLADVPSMQMHRFNAVNLPINEALQLTEEQLEFRAIKIPIADKSNHYTTKDYIPVVKLDGAGKDYIYLVYEEQVRYHYSNSNRLFLEVAVSRGVPTEDIENETEGYWDYLFCVKCYLAHTYPDLSNLLPDSN